MSSSAKLALAVAVVGVADTTVATCGASTLIPLIGPWSPDGSKIALEKPVTVSGSAGGVIAILDVVTGAERVLEATSAVMKDMADRVTDPDAFRTSSTRTYHDYAYEGWSWTPDGRSIVVLERHGTRPFLVDIETGQTTELRWEVDGAISWQRVRDR